MQWGYRIKKQRNKVGGFKDWFSDEMALGVGFGGLHVFSGQKKQFEGISELKNAGFGRTTSISCNWSIEYIVRLCKGD